MPVDEVLVTLHDTHDIKGAYFVVGDAFHASYAKHARTCCHAPFWFAKYPACGLSVFVVFPAYVPFRFERAEHVVKRSVTSSVVSCSETNALRLRIVSECEIGSGQRGSCSQLVPS